MESCLTVALSAKRIARVYAYSTTPLVDIREIFMVDDQARPGRKGISLTGAQWRALVARADDITRALEGLEAKCAAAAGGKGGAAGDAATGADDGDGDDAEGDTV